MQKLPEEEQVQIAKILLNRQRKNIQAVDPTHFPVLKLLKSSTAGHLAVEFLRVSSDGQKEGYSLEAQREMAGAYARKSALKCVQSWSVAESASKELDRKKFFEMVRYVSEHGIKNVIFDKIDRACRGLRAAVMIEDLVDAGVRFHFTRDNLVVDKSSSPSEKLRFYLGVVLAKHYIDNLKIEIQKGMDQRWLEGHWNGLAPLGYKNIRDDGGRARVILDPGVVPHLKELFELYATGNYSYKALATFLNDQGVMVTKRIREEVGDGIRIRREEVPVTHKCIENVVCNPFYYGARRKNGQVVRTGNEQHEGIISKELFDRCQKIKAIRAASTRVTLSHEIHKPLMGFMKCGSCGRSVTGEVHKKSSGRIYIYYHCANLECSQRKINVRQETILAQVTKAFEPFAKLSPSATAAFIENIQEQMTDLKIFSSEHLKEIEHAKQEIEVRCRELKDLYDAGALSESEFEEVIKKKRLLVQSNDIEIEAHMKASGETILAGLKIIELLGKSYDFMQLEGNELEKVRLAKLMLSNPILTDGNLGFDYKKPFDVLSDLTGHRKWWRRWELNPRPNCLKPKSLRV
jgi:site-specific DNA recombinase